MSSATQRSQARSALTLIELLVVIAIILAIAALAAAFAPRVSDNQNLTRAVDNLEQWLLTARMRAKRDGLATGIRFVQAPADSGAVFSQLQYIQQPGPISGVPNAATIQWAGQSAGVEKVIFSGVDLSLVQPGDYLEVRDAGVFYIGSVDPASSSITLTGSGYQNSLSITQPTTNFRILRQPRILIGEEPLSLPNNFVVDMSLAAVANYPNGSPDILFSPTGAVVGSNAGSGQIFLYVHDVTISDPNLAGIVAVQCRTGFIGAYSVNTTIPSGNPPTIDPFYFARNGRESGL